MIRVSDLNKTLNFFVDKLGFVEISKQENEKGRYTNIFIAAPDDIGHISADKLPLIELTYNWDPEEYTRGRNFGHIAYRVKNIYETCKELQKNGITINRPPRDGRLAFIKTPDNISIELLQDGDPLQPQEPWVSMENTGSW